MLIVENQLGVSDHTHLGKLLTYTAGTEASTVVWITRKLRDEHRQALTWLNEHTDTGTLFFGVELELVRIGDSLPAPDFDVVVMPNGWQKAVHRASGTSASGGGARGELYRQFWAALLDRINREHPTWTRASAPAQNWLWMAAPIRGCGVNAVFGHGSIRVELYIDRPSVSACEEVFDALHERRAEFEAAYGRPLGWDRMADRKACKITESAPGNVADVDEHDRYADWFLDGLARMRKAIAAVDGQSL